MIGKTNSALGSGELDTTNMPICFLYSTTANTSSSWQLGTLHAQSYNSDYVSYSNGVFTFTKACVCNVYGRGAGTRSSSGTAVTLQWRIGKNGDSTIIANGSGSGNTYDSASNYSFAVGDKVSIYGKTSSGDRCSMTLMVLLSE